MTRSREELTGWKVAETIKGLIFCFGKDFPTLFYGKA
jgi:hypothetical protein